MCPMPSDRERRESARVILNGLLSSVRDRLTPQLGTLEADALTARLEMHHLDI
jgi:hypothetical protein